MPITFSVAAHQASPVKGNFTRGLPATQLFVEACTPQYLKAGKVLGSSFEEKDAPYVPQPALARPLAQAMARNLTLGSQKRRLSRLGALFSKKPKPEPAAAAAPATAASAPAPSTSPSPSPAPLLHTHIIASPNGLFQTIADAYNHHHALVLRPDDIWLGILVQFNFYVNANAELLRANFVAHDGARELTVKRAVMANFGEFARAMVGEIEKNVVDPELGRWAIPDFSTTTENDQTVASIVLMATLKAYFEYDFDAVCCGIPRVTLEGTKADWEKLLARIEKLKEYGLEPTAWFHLLKPVLTRFVRTFDDPYDKEVQDFWSKVAHFKVNGSGPDYYSGWIAAFCVWDQHGKWIGPHLKENVVSVKSPEDLPAAKFWSTYASWPHSELQMDGTGYHRVEAASVPPAYAEVDVLLIDHNVGTTTQAAMTAGVIGTEVCSSRDLTLSEKGQNDVVRPVVGWWLFEKGLSSEYRD
ncbi:hypothetical protein HMN09_00191500 [Mycena chlorophos]|uniref:DUF4419 domain-containing protein n=1 Tax=Mycena chlorophos TaxID=658473 RepID=A0A8H6TLF8_MYCCL|nr:hypothetical protein HMN09_00191500 [Mycena chlorophos]